MMGFTCASRGERRLDLGGPASHRLIAQLLLGMKQGVELEGLALQPIGERFRVENPGPGGPAAIRANGGIPTLDIAGVRVAADCSVQEWTPPLLALKLKAGVAMVSDFVAITVDLAADCAVALAVALAVYYTNHLEARLEDAANGFDPG